MADVAVHEYGNPTAPPMVLVHGLTEAGTAWPDAVRRWGRDWRILAVDQRGHGSSPRFRDDELTRTPDVCLADLVRVVQSLPEPPVVVGHSLGGLMALRAGAAHPGSVRALVLEDPARPTGEWTPDPEFVLGQTTFLDRFVAGTDSEKRRMRVESGWTHDEIDAWADCKPLVDRRMVTEGLFLGDAAWEEVFESLRVPTLVVGPRGGQMLPRGVANPHVQVVEIEGVGHCVRRDDPEAFHAVVDPFLAGVSAG